jgi:hypothetical protein
MSNDLLMPGSESKGFFAAQVNLRSELAGLMIFVRDVADLEILEPPPNDPFLSLRVALNRMLPFSPNESPGHRKVTEGVVTFAFPGRFSFIQEGAAGVRVVSKIAEVQLGDKVAVAGFVTTERTLAALRGGLVRPLGRAAQPTPVDVSAEQILYPRLRSEWTGEAFEDFSGRLNPAAWTAVAD